MAEAVATGDSGLGRPAVGTAVIALVVCEVLMVALAFGWVAIYSYLVHPGEEAAFYERYALRASPWVALLAGVPLFLLAGRWIARRLEVSRARTTALLVMLLWLAMEMAFFAAGAQSLASMWPIWSANLVTKAAAIAFGVRLGAGTAGR